MMFYRINTDTSEKRKVKYPRNDYNPIYNIDSNIKYYAIVESEKPLHDSRTHRLVVHEDVIDEAWDGHDHIGVYNISYSVEQLPNDVIIQNLKDSVGQYIDEQYPYWEQNKHQAQIFRLLFEVGEANWDIYDQARFNWIHNLGNWARAQRNLRDQMEYELVEMGTLPDFIWEDRPEKPEILC